MLSSHCNPSYYALKRKYCITNGPMDSCSSQLSRVLRDVASQHEVMAIYWAKNSWHTYVLQYTQTPTTVTKMYMCVRRFTEQTHLV